MNPIFIAYQKAMMQLAMNCMMGIPHVPKNHPSMATGSAFASTDRRNEFPRSDMVVMAEEAEAEEKERNARKYLDNLAEEVKARVANGGTLSQQHAEVVDLAKARKAHHEAVAKNLADPFARPNPVVYPK